MKWFKHDTDASDDIKIRRLEEEYGNDGYAVFFKTLEIVGKEGAKSRLNLEKYPKKWISSRCHISEEKLSEILEFMSKISLLCPKSLKKNILYLPKFQERADEYTKRLRRRYGQATDNVPLEENRIDKNRREKIQLSDKDFILALKSNPSYKHIDVEHELGKMDGWLSTHPGRKKTRRFIVNWLNKVDKPVAATKRIPS